MSTESTNHFKNRLIPDRNNDCIVVNASDCRRCAIYSDALQNTPSGKADLKMHLFWRSGAREFHVPDCGL